MDWVCLLLDAHFTVLVMTPEAKGLLLNLHSFVKSQVTNSYSFYLLSNQLHVNFNNTYFVCQHCAYYCKLILKNAFLSLQVRLVSELGKIEGSLQELRKMKAKESIGQYSIEIIELF